MNRIGSTRRIALYMTGPAQTDEPREDERAGRTFSRDLVIFINAWHSPATIEHIEAIADSFPDWRFTIVQQSSTRRLAPYLKLKLKLWMRDPLSVSIRTGLHLIKKLQRPLSSQNREGPVHRLPTASELRRPNVAYQKFSRIHRQEALDFVRSIKPWLGLSIGAPILKKTLFSIPEHGTINIHKSLLPNYKGMPYGFWELSDDAGKSGVSIHQVDEGLDTGAILCAREHPISPYATVFGLAAELDAMATSVLIEVLRLIESRDGNLASIAVANDSKILANRVPSWFEAWKVYRKLQRRRCEVQSVAKRARTLAKNVILAGYVYVFAPIRNWVLASLGRSRTAILLYHRVSDQYLDNVTVGIEQFERQLDSISRRYDVLDLKELLESRGRPRRKTAVVLTFDDGYLDNYLAAMLLRRVKFPCTFFVSTKIVGTDRAFAHDTQALGHVVPTLDWDQIRQMRDWGFGIANHTQTHVDLAKTPIEFAVQEIQGASEDLIRELGPVAGAGWLAYPFGRATHITEEVKERLPDLQIQACLSAYGGTSRIDFDVKDLRRQGVDHRFSLLRLRAAIEGWTT